MGGLALGNVDEVITEQSVYRIAGNFRGRKLSRIGGKGAFRGENFRGMLKVVA